MKNLFTNYPVLDENIISTLSVLHKCMKNGHTKSKNIMPLETFLKRTVSDIIPEYFFAELRNEFISLYGIIINENMNLRTIEIGNKYSIRLKKLNRRNRIRWNNTNQSSNFHTQFSLFNNIQPHYNLILAYELNEITSQITCSLMYPVGVNSYEWVIDLDSIFNQAEIIINPTSSINEPINLIRPKIVKSRAINES